MATIHRILFYAIFFISGIAGLGYEILWTRMLSVSLGHEIVSVLAVVSAFFSGLALGAWFLDRPVSKSAVPQRWYAAFELIIGLWALALVYILPDLNDLVAGLIGVQPSALRHWSISFLYPFIILLPTLSMGATFSHLARCLRTGNGGVGRALCLNTLGGACAPLLFGVLLLPRIGIQYALLTIPAAYFLSFPRRHLAYAAAGGILALATVFVSLDSDPYRLLSLDQGDTVVSHREGVMASVSVVKDARNGFHLKVNNHFQMGGTTSVFSDKRQAYLPLLLHPAPQHALFLGVGSGTTLAAAADFPELNVEGVELIPEVIAAMGFFKEATGDLTAKKNLRILNADARRFVTATNKTYDVIVADLFHPSRDGAGSLYTVEHFAAIRRRLTDHGLFCQWLPLYQLDLETFKIIVRTFLSVFADGRAFVAHYSIDQPIIGLVGGPKTLRFPENWYRKRLAGKTMRRHMAGFGYDSVYSLLGTFMAGSDALRRYVKDGPLNTDQFPVVLFRAPLFVYGNPKPAHARLLALFDAFSSPDPETILAEVVTEQDRIARTRLSAYWAARDLYLELGTKIDRTRDVARLYDTASKPLLEVVRTSGDFSAAYFPLISIAYELYPHDRHASYQLLCDIERANPMRPEARVLRTRLFANRPS